MKSNKFKNIILAASCVAACLFINTAHAGKRDSDPVAPNIDQSPLTIINTVSQVNGAIGGFVCADGTITGDPADACGVQSILYPISGDVFAAVVDVRTGETIDAISKVGSITATPKFDVSFFGLANPDWSPLGATLPWECNDCALTLDNGSVFERIDSMPMTGRAFTGLGPVEDPNVTGTIALRMAGCAGIHEVSGTGPYANMVGTLCLNGTFTFDQSFNGVG
ncbi:MAG: hypothetical protein OEY89_10965, partial [Gammaproteobacteria bacterium]|nr:hypothetical protein [Gammaproteobacteria bacterium]